MRSAVERKSRSRMTNSGRDGHSRTPGLMDLLRRIRVTEDEGLGSGNKIFLPSASADRKFLCIRFGYEIKFDRARFMVHARYFFVSKSLYAY